MVNEFMKSIWLILPITVVTMILEAIAVKHMQSTQNSAIAGTMSSFLISWIGFRIYRNICISQDTGSLA